MVMNRLYGVVGGAFLGKIAVAVEEALRERAVADAPGRTSARLLAGGGGWTVEDVICTCGPADRPFMEAHTNVAIAMVVAGSFEYRVGNGSAAGELMTPGSLLLGAAGQSFECAHEHAAGDRCLSFHYTPAYFEQLAADMGTLGGRRALRLPRLPPTRALSPLFADACSAVTGTRAIEWDRLSMDIAEHALRALDDRPGTRRIAPPVRATARVTAIVRYIERHPSTNLLLEHLAREAGLSPYHFLRTFQQVAGVTPHQYVLRVRLLEAATRLLASRAPVIDIALDCGFGDLSNFNRAFRVEFGVSPRHYRARF